MTAAFAVGQTVQIAGTDRLVVITRIQKGHCYTHYFSGARPFTESQLRPVPSTPAPIVPPSPSEHMRLARGTR